MKPLHFIISTNGGRFAVGVIGDTTKAQEFGVSAENICGFNTSDELFSGLVFVPTVKAFKKLLILKEYFALWDEHWTKNKFGARLTPNIMEFTRRAIKRANIIMSSCVEYEDFVRVWQHNTLEYYDKDIKQDSGRTSSES